ncbi:MAG: GNAT family N-acetyltransferase [Oscillospiraceae bacterium]|nr:GNAT family N-acetyltransferase [Oscillospiraceae bacterium]
MKHKGTVRIETERLILRRFTENDAEAAFRNWTSDEKVTEYLRWQTHRELAASRGIVAEWVKNYERDDFYQWAIELKALGEPIGSISVVEQDERLDIVEIGYCIGSRWWDRGITSEAFSALLPFFFEEVGVNRIAARHDPDNPNSGRVMRRCGLKYEGTLRQADFNNRGVVDVCVYALLKEDWLTARR